MKRSSEYEQIVRDSRAAGMSEETAHAHAEKILAERDVWVVDPKTGKSYPAPPGPSIFDLDRRKRKIGAKKVRQEDQRSGGR